jgi:hypothetical protein
MTATLDSLSQVDDEGKQIEPGTLCFIRTGDEAPPGWQNKRSLAVWAGAHGQQRWMMLIPDDGIRGIDQVGWRIGNQVTAPTIERLHLRRFMSSHRGWWLPQAEFLETCLGHWCVQHRAFHATETCPPEMVAPPSDEPSRFAHTARIAELERQLAEARAANEALVKDHEEFKVRASEVLASEADSHDLCGEYDRIAEDAGLYPRYRDFTVEIEVTYRQTVVVNARSNTDAENAVRETAVVPGWYPDCPLNLDLTDTHTPADVTFKVIVEPPF